MSFVRLPNVPGKFYLPEQRVRAKKHACPDCHACQWCSDERCGICRGTGDGCCKPRPATGAAQRCPHKQAT